MNSKSLSSSVLKGVLESHNKEVFLGFLEDGLIFPNGVLHGEHYLLYWSEHIDVLNILSEKGAVLPDDDKSHDSFLWGAMWRIETLKWMARHGLDLQFRQNTNILIELIEREDADSKNYSTRWLKQGQFLVEHGVDIFKQDKSQTTPFDACILFNQPDWMDLLLYSKTFENLPFNEKLQYIEKTKHKDFPKYKKSLAADKLEVYLLKMNLDKNLPQTNAHSAQIKNRI